MNAIATPVVHHFLINLTTNVILGDIATLDEALNPRNHVTHGDAGIGAYEYWGYRGFDSQPYITIEEDSPDAKVKVLLEGVPDDLDLTDAGSVIDAIDEVLNEHLDTTYNYSDENGSDVDFKLTKADIKVDANTREVTFTLVWKDN
jgi:hypothetical protein